MKYKDVVTNGPKYFRYVIDIPFSNFDTYRAMLVRVEDDTVIREAYGIDPIRALSELIGRIAESHVHSMIARKEPSDEKIQD